MHRALNSLAGIWHGQGCPGKALLLLILSLLLCCPCALCTLFSIVLAPVSATPTPLAEILAAQATSTSEHLTVQPTATLSPMPTAAPTHTALPPTATAEVTATAAPPTITLTPTPHRQPARVVQVTDGDTIDVEIDGQVYPLRYIGVDSPERPDPASSVLDEGVLAAQANEKLVSGKTVWLEKDVSETDRYGRLLRYVYVGEMLVNAELVRLGYAWAHAYPPDVKYQALFEQLEAEARAARRGLWGATPTPVAADIVPVAPGVESCPAAQYSPANLCPGCPLYIASKKREPFHHPWCHWGQQISADNLQCFYSREEAIAAGHRPCKVCNP